MATIPKYIEDDPLYPFHAQDPEYLAQRALDEDDLLSAAIISGNLEAVDRIDVNVSTEESTMTKVISFRLRHQPNRATWKASDDRGLHISIPAVSGVSGNRMLADGLSRLLNGLLKDYQLIRRKR